MSKIKQIIGASILLLVPGLANASIISNATPLANAELWMYSVQGSTSNPQGDLVNISGTMLIDTTVREWSPGATPRTEICNCQNFFDIVAFDLRIGDLNFFGGGSSSNPRDNSIFFDTSDFPVSYVYGPTDWFLRPDGADQGTVWGGQYHLFYDTAGDIIPASDILLDAPAFIEMYGDFWNGEFFNEFFDIPHSSYLALTRASRVTEPTIMALFAAGIIGLGFARRRKA